MKPVSLLLFCIFFKEAPCQDILVKNINIIDVTTQKIHYKKTIHLSGNKIRNISNRPIKVKGAIQIKGKGKFIIPGLWDMHVHTVDSSYLSMFINNGITGVRDMGGSALNANNGCESIEPAKLMAWRKSIREGLIPGPHMLISGPAVTNTGWPTSININTPEKARDAVLKLKALEVDFIKVYEDIPIDAYLSLAKEAHEAGLTIAGHVPVKTISLIEASNAGQRSIEHLRDPLLMCFTRNREELLKFFKDDHWSESDIEWGLKQFGDCTKILEAFIKNDTWLVPTLTVEWSKMVIRDPRFINDPARKLLPASVQKAFQNYVTQKQNLSVPDKKSDSLWWTAQKQLVFRLHQEGIPMMAGTDCACEGGLPGYSLHKELQLLVEAGLTPFEALQTATINPAKFLKMTDSFGSVDIGKIADLVILERNPLDDISATQSIFAVVSKGKLVFRKRIHKIKE